MKVLPTDPEQRRRLIFMGILLALMTAAYLKWGMAPTPEIPKTTGPAPTSNPSVAIKPTAGKGRPQPTGPQTLRIAEMEDVPAEPIPGRNPFRFGVRPPPPPPPQPAYTPPPPPVYTPPPPPPIPPIPLFLTMIVAAGEQGPKPVAYLHDKNGNTFIAVEGDVVDGRYKLLRVGTTNVVMCYLDGTGQRTIPIGG